MEWCCKPGEILSFNEQVGERTVEKGYRSAPMIVADKSLQNAIPAEGCPKHPPPYIMPQFAPDWML
jgi:hypothetical protein